MGASSSVFGGGVKSDDQQDFISQEDRRRKSSSRSQSGDTVDCPTCQGTGRIPRGQENKLVAVIPCNDQRLKPRHTKLYVLASVIVCLLVCSLVLFFLFPRSVTLSPVAIKSSFVYFTTDTVQMNVTHIVNITNQNFATVVASNVTGQLLFFETVVGTINIKNATTVKPLSEQMYTFVIPLTLTDRGLNNYCKSKTIKIHTLFLHLQLSMTLYYLAHYEQVSLDTFEYIDCGANTTTPHLMGNQPGL